MSNNSSKLYDREDVTMSNYYSQNRHYSPSLALSMLNPALSVPFSFPSSVGNGSAASLLDPSSALFDKMISSDRETPIFDESMVILSQLQSITEQTLALQVRLALFNYS
jgi:hypothetical protein